MDQIYEYMVAIWSVVSIILMAWGAMAIAAYVAHRVVTREDRMHNNLLSAANALRNTRQWEIQDIFEDMPNYDIDIFVPGRVNPDLVQNRVNLHIDGRCFNLSMSNEDADALKQYLNDSSILQQRMAKQMKKEN